MSDYESKLEQFRRQVEERARRKAAEEAARAEQQTVEPAAQVEPAAKAEPVSVQIGPPLSQATGSASQVDRSAVLASTRLPASEPTDQQAFSQPALPAEPVPEVEDYLPWLKDEDEKQTEPEVQKPAAERPAPPVSQAPTGPAVIPASSLSTPRTYIPPTSIPKRDQSLPFEGTGEPRPVIKSNVEEKQPESPSAEVSTPESAQPVAAQPMPSRAEAPETAEKPAVKSKPAAVPTRVVLKQPVAPAQSAGAREIADMWDRLPRHIQLLMGTQPKEVAQSSYKKFKETRDELIQRLLDPTVSLEEAARILNVCPTTVRRYTNRGVLPHYRTAGNQRRFRLSDILAFLESMSKERQSLEEFEEVTA